MPFKQGAGKLRKDGTTRSAKSHAKRAWYIRIPTTHGYKSLSTGTTHKLTAQKMEWMIDELQIGARRDPELLAWLADRTLPKEDRLEPLTLLHYFERNQLDLLKAERAARLNPAEPAEDDVNQEVDRWYGSVKNRATKDHADRYLRAVRTFVPKGEVVPTERFTYQKLLDWSNALQEPTENDGQGLSANTARRYRVGLLDFVEYLVEAGMLKANALKSIDPPKPVPPRDRHLSTPDAIRLVRAFEGESNEALKALIERHGLRVEELQGFIALLNGAGVEVSVALALPVRNVSRHVKEVLAPGTKTYNRKRVVRVTEWAWPWVDALVEGRTAHDSLFASIPDRWIAADAFNAVITKLAEDEPKTFGDYWMRDGRHTYAVRAIKAGTPPKVVADQLGHKDPVMVNKVYGVYAPGGTERDYWEQRAAARDQEEGALPVRTAKSRRKPAAERKDEGRDLPMTNAGHRPKIAWPSLNELVSRLAARSVVAVAKELGVSDHAVRKHLRSNGIKDIPDGRRAGVAAVRQRDRRGVK